MPSHRVSTSFTARSASGKTTLADLATHAIYGRRFARNPRLRQSIRHRTAKSSSKAAANNFACAARTTRRPASGSRSPRSINRPSIRKQSANWSPACRRRCCGRSSRSASASRRELDWLLSPEFSHEFRAAMWRLKWAPPTRRTPNCARSTPGCGRSRPKWRRSCAAWPPQQARAAADAKADREREIAARRIFSPGSPMANCVRLRISPKAARRVVTGDGDFAAGRVALVDAARPGLSEPVPGLVSALRRHGVDCRWCSTSRSPARRPIIGGAGGNARVISPTAATRCSCSPPGRKRRSYSRDRGEGTARCNRCAKQRVADSTAGGRRDIRDAFAAA